MRSSRPCGHDAGALDALPTMPESRIAASYARLLHEYLMRQGCDPVRLLGDALDPGQHFVSMSQWQAWLAAVDVHEGHRPALGIRIAEGISVRHFGVLGYAALACGHLGQALQRMERYHASVYDANPAQIHLQDDQVCIEWGVARGRPGPLVDETAIASVVQLSRDLTGCRVLFKEVTFVNPRPTDLAPYEAFFGGVVRFDAPSTRLVFDVAWLAQPLRKSDPALLAMLDQQAETLLQRVAHLPLAVDAWRRSLVPLIREGRTSLAALARAHHLSARSLQRRLADQGMTFQGLLDETRRHLAEAYLRDERLDLAEIALLLGYSEQSAFTRAFRTWTGLPPAQWLRWATTDLRDA